MMEDKEYTEEEKQIIEKEYTTEDVSKYNGSTGLNDGTYCGSGTTGTSVPDKRSNFNDPLKRINKYHYKGKYPTNQT